MTKLFEHPTFRRAAWIGAGAGGLLTLVGAVWLAVRAQSTDPPAALKEPSADARLGPSSKAKPRRGRPESTLPPMVAPQPEPGEAAAASRPPLPGGREQPLPAGEPDHGRSKVVRPPVASPSSLRLPGVENPPLAGRLSPEELEKRRNERKGRQEDRLKNRIKTLEERIQSYRKDGTRTEAQIERMEKSLERMRQRLGRMDEPDKP